MFGNTFNSGWYSMQEAVHRTAEEHGWWTTDLGEYKPESFNKSEKIALMHSELSEALEALRTEESRSAKIPMHSHVEEELADCVIRIMDFAAAYGYDVGGAIVVKNEYNKGRPYKHGGKKF